MPTRTVTVMGLIQVMALTVTYLLAAANLKSWEKSFRILGFLEWLEDTPKWKWLTFTCSCIWLLLLIPVAMGVVCGRLTCTHRDIAILGQGGFGLAVVVTVAVIVFSAYIIAVATGGAPYREFLL